MKTPKRKRAKMPKPEAVLNHLPPKLIRTYDRNPYGTEKRSALSAWSGHLQTILARADGGNVVSMRGT